MNRFLATFFLAASSLLIRTPYQAVYAQAAVPVKQWDQSLGGNQGDALFGVHPIPAGGYLLTGLSSSGISGDKTQPNQGVEDYWVVRLDATGTKQWDRTFGGRNMDLLNASIPTSDGGYLLGGQSSSGLERDKTQASQGSFDYWVVKIDATGTKQWDKTFGGTSLDVLTSLLQTSDGGYLLGGRSASGISGDKTQATNGLDDEWLVKIDANGNKQWDRTFGGSGSEQINALVATPDGGYLLGGHSNSPISGDKTQPSQGGSDYWLLKVDAMGTKQWDRTFGGTGTEALWGLQPTTNGGYLLAGHSDSGLNGDKTQVSQGANDYWVVKVDATGTKQWDRTFGGSGNDSAYDLQPTSDGGYLLGGRSDSPPSGDKTQSSQGGFDQWVVKLDAMGLKQWDLTFGGSGDETLWALQQTSDGGYILGGSSSSGISGDKTRASQGSSDYWVVKLGAAPLGTTAATSRPTLSAFPNPTHASLIVAGAVGTPYQVLNQLGQVVRSGHLSAQPVDVHTLPAGIYLVRDQNSGYSSRFIKE